MKSKHLVQYIQGHVHFCVLAFEFCLMETIYVWIIPSPPFFV